MGGNIDMEIMKTDKVIKKMLVILLFALLFILASLFYANAETSKIKTMVWKNSDYALGGKGEYIKITKLSKNEVFVQYAEMPANNMCVYASGKAEAKDFNFNKISLSAEIEYIDGSGILGLAIVSGDSKDELKVVSVLEDEEIEIDDVDDETQVFSRDHTIKGSFKDFYLAYEFMSGFADAYDNRLKYIDDDKGKNEGVYVKFGDGRTITSWCKNGKYYLKSGYDDKYGNSNAYYIYHVAQKNSNGAFAIKRIKYVIDGKSYASIVSKEVFESQEKPQSSETNSSGGNSVTADFSSLLNN